MERVDLFVKTVIGIVGGTVSWMVGGLGLAFVVLLGLMVLDFITGLLVGSTTDGLNSGKGKKGLQKKLYIILLIGAAYLIESLVLESNGVVGDGIAVSYCVIEFISIVENGGRLGVPLGPVRKIIEVLKNKGDAQ